MDITKIFSVTKTRVPRLSAAVSWIPQRSQVFQRQEYPGYPQLFNGYNKDIQGYKDKITRYLQLFNGYNKDIQGYKDKSTKVFPAV